MKTEFTNNKGCLYKPLMLAFIMLAIIIATSCSEVKHVYFSPIEEDNIPAQIYEESPMDTTYINSHNIEYFIYSYPCNNGYFTQVQYWRKNKYDNWNRSIYHKKCKLKRSFYHDVRYKRSHYIETSRYK